MRPKLPKPEDPELAQYWRARIDAAQAEVTELLAAGHYLRIPYFPRGRRGPLRCPDCGVTYGQLHVRGCGVERCAKCRHQATLCLCRKDG